MFNLGLPEMLVIGAAALLVFGPKRLPELAKSLGKGLRDFKKALEGGGEDQNEQVPPGDTLSHNEPAEEKKSGDSDPAGNSDSKA